VTDLTSLIERFADTRLVVVGDAVLERWISGTSQRFCRDAPIPLLEVSAVDALPAAAASTAVSVAALGGPVQLVSYTGVDDPADALRTVLHQARVDASYVLADADVLTPAKQRLVYEGQVVARYDSGPDAPPGRELERRLAEALTGAAAGTDAILVSGYGYGLGDEVRVALNRIRHRRELPMLIEADECWSWAGVAATVVVSRFADALRLCDVEPCRARGRRDELVAEHASRLLERTRAAMVVVILDGDGAILLAPDRSPYRTSTTPALPGRRTRIADTFAAAMTLSLGAGASPEQAVDIAQAAAGVVGHRASKHPCTAGELMRELDRGPGVQRPGLADHGTAGG
jgi:D-beta-D-heptose 7-phosphate kinase/D-beta-D-heptose 1-phosphate adenosyltransferase